MKILTKRLVTALLTLAVLLGGVFAMGEAKPAKTDASASETQPQTIFYFSDYYPTLSYKEMETMFGAVCEIKFVHLYVDNETFGTMVMKGFYSECPQNSIAVIDLKTFMPDPQILYTYFEQLKSLCNSVTIFVTDYEELTSPSLRFLKYVDYLIYDKDLTTLVNFISAGLFDLTPNYARPLSNTAYLIDKNVLTLGSSANMKNFLEEGIAYLCRTSPFLRNFMQQLARSFDLKDWDGEHYQWFEETVGILTDKLYIHFLVCLKGDMFVDLFTRETIQFTDVEKFMKDVGGKDIHYLCAFGFWMLDQESYIKWLDIQYKMKYDLPVYVLEVEEIQYDPNGLKIITDSDLKRWYGGEFFHPDAAANALSDILQSLVRSFVS